MASTVSWAHVPTDHCSSNLSQMSLNVHRQAPELKEKSETVGWSKFCDTANLKNDITSHFFESLPSARLWSKHFSCNNLFILASVLEGVYCHLHFTDEVDLRDWEAEEPAKDHVVKPVPAISVTACREQSRELPAFPPGLFYSLGKIGFPGQ